MVIFPTLRQQKLSLLISLLKFCMSFVDLQMASFLYCFPYCSSNYCDSNSCRSFTLLKALAKRNGNLIGIAFKSEKELQLSGRAIILERKPSKKKQRTDTKKDAKRIKSDNFTRSNREKSDIAIAILEKLIIGWHHNYFVEAIIFSPTIFWMSHVRDEGMSHSLNPN